MGELKKLGGVLDSLRRTVRASDGPPSPLSMTSVTVECAPCGGAGFTRRDVPLDHPDFGRSFRCPDCNPLPPIVGVPPRHEWTTFDSFDLSANPGMRQGLDPCGAVAERRAWCAFLVGDYGTGKTHLAVAAGRASEWQRPTRFWRGARPPGRLRAAGPARGRAHGGIPGA